MWYTLVFALGELVGLTATILVVQICQIDPQLAEEEE